MHSDRDTFESAAFADAEGSATPDEQAMLQADPAAWQGALGRLVREAEETRL